MVNNWKSRRKDKNKTTKWVNAGSGIAQSMVCWAVMRDTASWVGPSFEPVVKRIFLLELAWVLTPFRQNSFGWEYKPRSGLCTNSFHHTDSKDPDIHVLDGWMPATKHTQHAPSTKTECDYIIAGLNSGHTHTKFSPTMVKPRDIAGNPEEKGLENGHTHEILTNNGETQRYNWECRIRRRIKKTVTHTKFPPTMVKPRDIAGNPDEG